MNKAEHQSAGRREVRGYPKRTIANEVKGRAISSEELLVAAILLSAALMLVTFLAPVAKRFLVPGEGSSTFSKHGATATWGKRSAPPASGRSIDREPDQA
ncbi:MAG: hypothetical protein Q7J60_12570 [Bradyrhizobium sp.]|uniref:hypothetical protein n=1 Tax=Bradyrhizobium sp. TaxID=376 RepID=UPI00271E01FB|nr:hypothetical protein [Bradyrhizobium sp.]MDO9562449.1 hypothetical protein [Bradyrhizobium sp.]MDP3691048.1 hypothetical protein [Bradyrhizobium sp.]